MSTVTKNKQKDWMRVSELADKLLVSRKTIYAWVKTGKVPRPITISRMMWDREAIQEWIDRQYDT